MRQYRYADTEWPWMPRSIAGITVIAAVLTAFTGVVSSYEPLLQLTAFYVVIAVIAALGKIPLLGLLAPFMVLAFLAVPVVGLVFVEKTPHSTLYPTSPEMLIGGFVLLCAIVLSIVLTFARSQKTFKRGERR